MSRSVLMGAPAVLTGLAVFVGCAQSGHLERNEQVVFFPTVGYAVDGGSEWVVPVRGRVYESSWLSKHLNWAGHVLDIESFIEDPAERAILRERITPFVVDGSKGREVTIAVGNGVVRLNPALEHGQFYEELRVPADQLLPAQEAGTPAAQVVQYRAVVSKSDPREYTGRVHLLASEGLSIVSDIDDTIRVTDVNNTKQMVKNTFIEPFRPVSGMPELYREWADRCGAEFHYLSASPAALAEPMAQFIADNYPDGSICLRDIEHQSSTLRMVLSMFDAPPDYKIEELAWLMRALPNRRYVLIGDSGQNDPEVYGLVARAFQPQVQLILIRDVTCCQGRNSPRYQAAFAGLPDSMWVLFREPAEIRSRVDAQIQYRLGLPKRARPPQNRSTPLLEDVFVQQVAAYK